MAGPWDRLMANAWRSHASISPTFHWSELSHMVPQTKRELGDVV
jgi:hypothetical protein